MDFLFPRSWPEALHTLAGRPDISPVAGGTDVMVRWNMGRGRPRAALDLSRLTAPSGWRREGDRYRLGATLTYTALAEGLAHALPGLCDAAGAVGSRQIRNRGTLGGSLGSAWTAGDAHPALLACGAEVELDSVRGTRRVPVRRFFAGPGQTVRTPNELIKAVLVPVAEGPQVFTKVGGRAVSTLATCSFAVALWPSRQRAGTGLGGAADRPRTAPAAEEFLAAELTERDAWESRAPLTEDVLRRFGELAAEGVPLGDDVRASAAYRRRVLPVLARRALAQAWENYRTERHACA